MTVADKGKKEALDRTRILGSCYLQLLNGHIQLSNDVYSTQHDRRTLKKIHGYNFTCRELEAIEQQVAKDVD